MATRCPISKADFMARAEPIKVDLGGSSLVAAPREFSTGSFGWYLNGKITLVVDGKALQVQIGANFTVVGSKEAAG